MLAYSRTACGLHARNDTLYISGPRFSQPEDIDSVKRGTVTIRSKRRYRSPIIVSLSLQLTGCILIIKGCLSIYQQAKIDGASLYSGSHSLTQPLTPYQPTCMYISPSHSPLAIPTLVRSLPPPPTLPRSPSPSLSKS